MESVSNEESIRRWSLICIECGKPSDGGGVVQLALGHMIHRQCYEAFLRQQEDAARKCGWRTLASVVQLLPGEKGLTREQIAQRRHEMLYGESKKQLKTSEARMESSQQVRQPVGGVQ